MSQLDIKSLVDSNLATAFDVAGQAAVTATLVLGPGAGAYNSVTDTKAAVATYIVQAFFYRSIDQRLSIDAAKTASLLVRYSTLAALGYTGDMADQDQVIINGVTWTVYEVTPDPVRAMIILKIRR